MDSRIDKMINMLYEDVLHLKYQIDNKEFEEMKYNISQIRNISIALDEMVNKR